MSDLLLFQLVDVARPHFRTPFQDPISDHFRTFPNYNSDGEKFFVESSLK
ncbi:MAG: hypothetical protein GY729_13690 [Desulfobacteraceae bacterium]|nr:hypothetical protein [Desulfobacteraceae bacterium]